MKILLLICVIALTGCWGPYQVSADFRQVVDTVHDDSISGAVIVQTLTCIPVIPLLHAVAFYADHIIFNPANLVRTGKANPKKGE